MKKMTAFKITLILSIITNLVVVGMCFVEHEKLNVRNKRIQSLEAIQHEYTKVINAVVSGNEVNGNLALDGYAIDITQNGIVIIPQSISIADYYGVIIVTSGEDDHRTIKGIDLYKP